MSEGELTSLSVGMQTDNIVVAETYQDIVDSILTRKDAEIGIWGTFMNLLGTYAVVQQYDLLERQTDMNERMVDYAERYLELAEDNYQDITLDAYQANRALFDRFVTSFQPFETEFLSEAGTLRTYTPNYAAQQGRATAGVGQQFTMIRQRRARQRNRYAMGECCHENLMLDIAQAGAMSDAMNRGYRFEDEKKLRLDDWYWQHYSQAMQLVENMRSNVITGLNGGVANATGAVSAISGMMSQANAAVRGAGEALQDQASFFGTLANGAFRMSGFAQGQAGVQGMIGNLGAGARGLFGGNVSSQVAVQPQGGISTGYNIMNVPLALNQTRVSAWRPG